MPADLLLLPPIRLQLLLKSPDDQVVLLHVQQKGHPLGSGTLGQQASGSNTLTLNDTHGSAPGISLPPQAASMLAAPQAEGGAGSQLARVSGLARLSSPAGSSLSQWGSSGSYTLLGLTRSGNQGGEGCAELLERSRQQLLEGCKR